jgi:(p)ppGpp synthase/HD superfamily hydrolase
MPFLLNEGVYMNSPAQKARRFAIAAHGDQKYNSHPYSYHLDAVVDLLSPFGETAQVIGYLHDVIEDTSITRSEIEEDFGSFVADCVAIVTDEAASTRKERKERTHAKISKVTKEFELALIVKAADRLANLQASMTEESATWLAMYRKEHADFRAAVYRSGLCDDLWDDMAAALAE